tara:strand:+ start:477 stop:659 length:183 start_codon:yes stop_codon:yes gene_type:complete
VDSSLSFTGLKAPLIHGSAKNDTTIYFCCICDLLPAFFQEQYKHSDVNKEYKMQYEFVKT